MKIGKIELCSQSYRKVAALDCGDFCAYTVGAAYQGKSEMRLRLCKHL